MSKEKFETSLSEGRHKQLNSMLGEWMGTTKTWFEPNQLADESATHGKIRSILDGRFIMHEYHGSLQSKPLQGIAIYGYSVDVENYQSAWVNSFHMGTGIMYSEGKAINGGFSVLGSYSSVEYPQPWGWRTEIRLVNPDQLIITAYNITPEGEEAKAVETVYNRVKS